MNFFKVAKIIIHDILLTVDKLIITLAVNRLTCYKPLCAFSHNPLHYHQSYKETCVRGRYNVYKGWAQEKLISSDTARVAAGNGFGFGVNRV